MSRIEAVEATDEFIIWKNRSLKRSARGIEVANQKRKRLLGEIAAWKPIIQIPKGDLVKLACDFYIQYQESLGRYDCYINYTNSDFIKRIVGNYLRHECTDYDTKLTLIKGKVGAGEAYEELKKIVMATINNEITIALANAGIVVKFE